MVTICRMLLLLISLLAMFLDSDQGGYKEVSSILADQ
jgi:hypothetical protein